MISKEVESQILRLFHAERWRIGTLARQLGVHHTTVRRVLADAGLPQGRRSPRPSIADPFMPFIVETLEAYPTLPASRLYQMVCERGYPGGPEHFRVVVRRVRPRKPAEAYLRLRTLPGEEGQMDWASFGKHAVGRAIRRLSAFVMVLSWSRALFVRFFWDQRMASFLAGHVAAFEEFGAVPRRLLYDNLKSAVLERRDTAIRFHPTLLALASHYRFEPRPVAVARGNEKGRVERAIRYLRTSFFPARKWASLADLNDQVGAWCRGPAAERRCPEDDSLTVRIAAEIERPRLLPLPGDSFPAEECREARVGRTPYVRFDLNDYSVPHDRVRRTVQVRVSPARVRILDGTELVAEHVRAFDKGALIENPAHVEALVQMKREAREHRGMDRLHRAVPSSPAFFDAVAERGGNLGATTNGLLRLLDQCGAVELDAAVTEALERGTPHLSAIHQILDRRRRARELPPPVTLDLPDDPRLKDLVVRPHSLERYNLETEDNDDAKPKR